MLVVVAIGCGGRSAPPRRYDRLPESSPPAGPPDLPAMRALLDRFSPTGAWIMHSDDTLPHEFTVAGQKLTLTSSASFATLFTDGNPDRLVDQMDTCVHELYHAITTRLGYQLLVDAKAPRYIKAQGVYTGAGSPVLLEFSALYPAREMASTFPPEARTFRFPTYVSPSGDTQGTQVDGVFGLLDEWTAYFHGSRTVLDFWPWVRDEAPRTEQLNFIYRARFHGMWVAYAEFKLFILHYVIHARTNHPDVYRGLLGNASFRRAFVAIDDAWTKLLAEATDLEPQIVSLTAQRGAPAAISYNEDAYPAVQRLLASEPYQRALAEVRGR